MAKETQELIAYSIDISGTASDARDELTRNALSGLFYHMARTVQDREDFPIHKCKKITLELEHERWDYCLVLRLTADEEGD